MIDRRTFLAAAAALPVACSSAVVEPKKNVADLTAPERFEAIRATLGPGGRIGVAAIESGSGRRLLHDAESRYAMASTFKLPLAAMVLAEAERGTLQLGEELQFDAGPPLDNSPVVAANLGRGRLAAEALAAAIVVRSDNSAANLLLRRLGGPQAFTRFMREAGDPVSRLDRYEMDLGTNLPGDLRDTTTPLAMARLVETLTLGDRLSVASRARLIEWLTTSIPGSDRLRAGLPVGWRFGHKTGTASNGGVNDVGIAWPPDRAPIVIASYQSGGDAPMSERAAAHAAVGRLVAEAFG